VAPTVAQPVAPTVPPAPAPRVSPRPGTRGVDAVPPGNGSAAVEPAAPAPVSAGAAAATLIPQLDLRLGSGDNGELRLNGTVGVVLMMGLLTLVPTLLLMMTGFTRILIVLHFLKQAMGTQSAPPAHLVAGLALLLTGFVMAPTLSEANRTALSPWLAGEIEQVEMLKTGVQPFRTFMLRQTNEKDLRTFVGLSRMEQPETPDDVPLHVLMSAFVASELRTAFQIGFAIYLPFIVIDAVVASVLMAMGMFMLPPAMISLPFKLLLFVLVDGWSLTIQSLVQSFR
jgi:flagellar biosynthetic protein FliP